MTRVDAVIPLLAYQDIPAAHDFLVNVFGFTAGSVIRDGEGRPVHGEVRIGDTTMWLHAVTPEHGLTSAAESGIPSSGLVVHVDDVDAHYEHAKSSGARIDSEPVNQPYGQREYGVRDSEGHRWWFATPVAAPGKG